MKFIAFLAMIMILLLNGCSEKKEESKANMKCGTGKCGANMFDGNAALNKKKKNILSQMREDDSRRECVMEAVTTRAVYDCVRDPQGHTLTLKCGTGKCGNAEDASNTDPHMKCGSAKCGDSQ